MPQEHLKGQLYPTNEYWILWPILCPKNGLQGAKWSQERFQGPKLTGKGLTRACLRTELMYMFAHSIYFMSCLKELGYTPWNKTSSQQPENRWRHTEQKQQLGRISPDIHSHKLFHPHMSPMSLTFAGETQPYQCIMQPRSPGPTRQSIEIRTQLLSSTPKTRQYPTHIIIMLDNQSLHFRDCTL